MSRPVPSVTFEFIDPTDALIRLLLLSPLAAKEENLSFFPKDGLYFEDFHDEKECDESMKNYQRVQWH